MMKKLIGCAAALLLLPGLARADQTEIGPWNAAAAKLGEGSALVKSAMTYIGAEVATIKDPAIRGETIDAVFNPDTCVKSRAGLMPERKRQIVDALVAAQLIDPDDGPKIPGGLVAGVFPGLRDDGTSCPKLPMPYSATPGSVFGGHHSQPGGLPMHVAVNLTSSMNLADTYRKVFGTLNAQGLPVVRDGVTNQAADVDFTVDQDLAIGCPVWHDWAKTFVFQWNADGSEYTELNFGGNGKTDALGKTGTSKTGGHHIMGIAETMARGLPPVFVIAQASAHGAPSAGNEFSVVNWLRAAAIIDGIDPVERGYLTKDSMGRLRLPAVRKLGSVDIIGAVPAQSNLLYEYVMHNLSDADYTFTGNAVPQSELFLRVLAPKFGYDPADVTRYNTEYRNPVLTNLSAERVQILYANGGIDRVEREIAKLRSLGLVR